MKRNKSLFIRWGSTLVYMLLVYLLSPEFHILSFLAFCFFWIMPFSVIHWHTRTPKEIKDQEEHDAIYFDTYN